MTRRAALIFVTLYSAAWWLTFALMLVNCGAKP